MKWQHRLRYIAKCSRFTMTISVQLGNSRQQEQQQPVDHHHKQRSGLRLPSKSSRQSSKAVDDNMTMATATDTVLTEEVLSNKVELSPLQFQQQKQEQQNSSAEVDDLGVVEDDVIVQETQFSVAEGSSEEEREDDGISKAKEVKQQKQQQVVLGGDRTILKPNSTVTTMTNNVSSTAPSSCMANADTSSSGNNQKPLTKKVKFSVVNVRYYERILSDHPSVQSGPAIGLGWKFYTREDTQDQRQQQQQQQQQPAGCSSEEPNHAFDIKEYERLQRIKKERKAREEEERREYHSARSSRRSNGNHNSRLVGRQYYEQTFVLSRFERECILKEWGYQPMEVAKMIRRIIKVKNQRRQTFNNLGRFEMIEEYIENIQRRVSKTMYCLITLNQKSKEEIMYQTYKKNLKKKKTNWNGSSVGNSNGILQQ